MKNIKKINLNYIKLRKNNNKKKIEKGFFNNKLNIIK